MKREDYIITEKDGRFGLSLKDGTVITECVYDEIRHLGDSFVCRFYDKIDVINISDGSHGGDWGHYSSGDESFWGGVVVPKKKTLEDVFPFKRVEGQGYCEGFIRVYENGKFGISAPDGHQILPCEYDELKKWLDAKVIATRQGNAYRYFDTDGVEILTDRSATILKDDFPYVPDGWENDYLQIKELVDKKTDEHTYESKVGYVSLRVMMGREYAKDLFAQCDILPMPQKANKNFVDDCSYGYIGFIGIFDINTPASNWIKKMKGLHAFKKVFHIDKFSTNSQTHIKLSQFVELKRYYQDHVWFFDNVPCLAYTTDESLEDGQVRWEHVEHYKECGSSAGCFIHDLICYGTLDELKQVKEKVLQIWDEDFLCDNVLDFGCINPYYSKNRSWEETKKVLEYVAEYNPNYDYLLLQLRVSQYDCSILKFCSKVMQFALEKGANPNQIYDGKTHLDKLQDAISLCRKDNKIEAIEILQEAIGTLRSYGGMSKKELREMQDKKIAQLAPDAYDYLKEI